MTSSMFDGYFAYMTDDSRCLRLTWDQAFLVHSVFTGSGKKDLEYQKDLFHEFYQTGKDFDLEAYSSK